MKFVIKDYRNEERSANVRRDITGALTERAPSNYDPNPRPENYDQRKTIDSREVEIKLEPEDFVGENAVPEVMQGSPSGKHGGEFFVRSITIRYSRSFPNTDTDTERDNWSRYGEIYIRGINRRADGTEGAKDNATRFPVVREVDSPEIWTLAEIEESGYRYPDGTIPNWEMNKVGKPKKVRVVDPLPGWLAAIVDRVHPRTGLPFAHDDEHRFGEFAPQPEMQALTTV